MTMRRRRTPVRYIYAPWVVHPVTGKVRCGYVGKTGWLQVRIGEHMRGGTSRCPTPQPWADTVVEWKVLFAGRAGKLTLSFLEVAFILLLRPLYNVQWNRLNGRRIPRSVAARQERSAACLNRAGCRTPVWVRVLRSA